MRTFCFLMALFSSCTVADTVPLWEMGLGAGTLHLPDYRGSDESRSYVFPAPYLIYRGEYFRSDRNGLRGRLFDTERAEISLSLNATPPVSGEENAARRGMEPLRPTLEVGPVAELTLWQGSVSERRLDLRLPLRAVFSVSSPSRHVGWVFAPRLDLDWRDPPGMAGWNLGMVVSPLVGSRRLHDYFYTVNAEDVAVGRSAYSARAGYSGLETVLSLSKRFETYWVGAFVRNDNLRSAVFADSPLVRSHRYTMAGFAVSWIFAESAQRVEEEH